jgi:hypothetical protein
MLNHAHIQRLLDAGHMVVTMIILTTCLEVAFRMLCDENLLSFLVNCQFCQKKLSIIGLKEIELEEKPKQYQRLTSRSLFFIFEMENVSKSLKIPAPFHAY